MIKLFGILFFDVFVAARAKDTSPAFAIASLNREKSDKITDRARVFARELYDAKLLSEDGWKAVER